MKISVQLYTLRDSFEKDLWGTFDNLAEIGFKNVELAGLYGLTAQELKDGLAQRGIKASGTHTGLGELENDLDHHVAIAHTFGIETLIVPWLNINDFPGGWTEVGNRLNAIAPKLAAHDLKIAYHNHDFEFAPDNSPEGQARPGYDVLWQTAKPEVRAEVDVYWVQKAGHDPVAWLEKLGPRNVYTHFKDIDENGFFTQVGQGKINWDGVIDACKKQNVEYAVIENDQPQIDPVEAVRQSREFLLSKGLSD